MRKLYPRSQQWECGECSIVVMATRYDGNRLYRSRLCADSGRSPGDQNALTNWNNAGNSGVTFQFSSTPVSGPNTYTVNRQQPSLGAGYQGETGGTASGGHRSTAFSNIDPGVTNTTALTQAMSHETGHTFGLDDTGSNCQNGGSAMNLANSLNDTTRGSNGPTNCDNQASSQYNNYPTPTPTPTPCKCIVGCCDGDICGEINSSLHSVRAGYNFRLVGGRPRTQTFGTQ